MKKRKSFILAVFMAVIAVTVIIVYYRFDPTASWWMPRCPSKLLTGYDCPGCGSQRMLHALLHGDIAAAWRFNPFILLSLPFLAVAIWGNFSSLPGAARMRAVAHSPYVVWAYVVAFFGWWILRNWKSHGDLTLSGTRDLTLWAKQV